MKEMSPRQVEARAIQILDRLTRNEFREDSLVELKREFPEDYKAARRIAAHCNASRGDTILWIIGADEEKGVVGAKLPDFAELLPRIWSFFSAERPDCTEVVFEYSGMACAALAFTASRTPYLVKNPSFGAEKTVIEREIPWRDGTRVRTATRDEVLRLSLDYAKIPDIEVFQGTVSKGTIKNRSDALDLNEVLLDVYFRFYVMLRDDKRVVIPIHRITARLTDFGTEYSSGILENIQFCSEEGARRRRQMMLEAKRTGGPIFPAPEPDDSVKCTGTEVIISRPALVHLNAEMIFSRVAWEQWDQFDFEITLKIGVERVPLVISSKLRKKLES